MYYTPPCPRALTFLAILALSALALVSPARSAASTRLPLPAIPALPSPSPTPTFFLNPAGFDLAQPHNLAPVTSSGQCRQNFFLDQQVAACDSGLTSGNVVLVWSYVPSSCLAKTKCQTSVTGFNVLKSASGPNGDFHLSDNENADPSQTGVALSEKIDENQGVCFAVQPYSGSDIGPASQPYCVPLPTPPMVLSPDGIGTSHFEKPMGPNASGDGDYCTTVQHLYKNDAKIPNVPPGQFLVGYRDNADLTTDQNPNNPCIGLDDVYSGALHFDLSKLPKKPIAKAVLDIVAADGLLDYKNNFGEIVTSGHAAPACVARYGYAPNKQWLSPGQTLFPFEQVGSVGYNIGHTAIDITAMVDRWVSGPNYGIILAGTGDGTTRDNLECLSLYGNVTLTISFKN